MEEIIYYTNLFDYYEELLTPTQREYFKSYYFENLSLSEISENYNISRNAASKTIKDVKDKLDYYEEKLSLYSNKLKIIELIDKEILSKIEEYI